MLRTISRFAFQLSNGNVSVFATFMGVAVLIVILRSLASYEILIDDMGVQIEAGYRLVSGFGLTHSSFDLWGSLRDLTKPVQRKYLTAFPPFLSLYVAGALFLGLSLVTSLKLLFGFVTLAGWLGWALIGSLLMSRRLDLKNVKAPAHILIACLLPLLFTPPWQGTDIILWAGTPFVILLLLSSLEVDSQWRCIAAAGLLSGFLYSVRYASAYLAVAAFLIIAYFHYRQVKTLVRVYGSFLAASMVFILPTALYGKYAKTQTAGITEHVHHDLSLALDNFTNVISALTHGLTPYIFWIPQSVRLTLFRVNNNPSLQLACGVLTLLLLLLAPLFILRYADIKQDEKGVARRHLAVALCLVILSLLLFLALASVFMAKEVSHDGYQFVLDSRYYIASGGSSIFIFYYLCTQTTEKRWSVVPKRIFTLIIIGFISYCVALPTLAFVAPSNNTSHLIKHFLPSRVAGTTLDRAYPSNELIRPKKTIRVVQQLSAEEPQAIFFMTAYYNILFDNFNPQLRYFWTRAAKVVLTGAYVSKSTKVYFVLGEYAASDQDFSTILGKSGFQEFMSIPEDETTIFAAQLPAGFSFDSALAN